VFVCVNQYAMMEHFYHNKASILCRPIREACTYAAQLSSNQLAEIRSCDSFQRYIFADCMTYFFCAVGSVEPFMTPGVCM